jgi:hypothetical protein
MPLTGLAARALAVTRRTVSMRGNPIHRLLLLNRFQLIPNKFISEPPSAQLTQSRASAIRRPELLQTINPRSPIQHHSSLIYSRRD